MIITTYLPTYLLTRLLLEPELCSYDTAQQPYANA